MPEKEKIPFWSMFRLMCLSCCKLPCVRLLCACQLYPVWKGFVCGTQVRHRREVALRQCSFCQDGAEHSSRSPIFSARLIGLWKPPTCLWGYSSKTYFSLKFSEINLNPQHLPLLSSLWHAHALQNTKQCSGEEEATGMLKLPLSDCGMTKTQALCWAITCLASWACVLSHASPQVKTGKNTHLPLSAK